MPIFVVTLERVNGALVGTAEWIGERRRLMADTAGRMPRHLKRGAVPWMLEGTDADASRIRDHFIPDRMLYIRDFNASLAASSAGNELVPLMDDFREWLKKSARPAVLTRDEAHIMGVRYIAPANPEPTLRTGLADRLARRKTTA